MKCQWSLSNRRLTYADAGILDSLLSDPPLWLYKWSNAWVSCSQTPLATMYALDSGASGGLDTLTKVPVLSLTYVDQKV
jgi:hypothetical protein